MAFPFLRRSGTLPRLCGLLVILATGALFALVGCFALPVLWSAQGSLIFSWAWRPPADFGILPMLAGSLILSFSALLLAWPLSLGLACALQDPRPAFWQKWLTGLIRFMTAIPTVVYGFAAVFLLTPLVREAAGQGSGLCWLSAACVLALLISPTMVLVMDVALREQMRRLLLPALSLGMSRDTVLACLALPAVRRWLLTAGLLGFGRSVDAERYARKGMLHHQFGRRGRLGAYDVVLSIVHEVDLLFGGGGQIGILTIRERTLALVFAHDDVTLVQDLDGDRGSFADTQDVSVFGIGIVAENLTLLFALEEQQLGLAARVDRSPGVHAGFVGEADVAAISVVIAVGIAVAGSRGSEVGCTGFVSYHNADSRAYGESRTVNGRFGLSVDRGQHLELLGLTRSGFIPVSSIFALAAGYNSGSCKRQCKNFLHNEFC